MPEAMIRSVVALVLFLAAGCDSGAQRVPASRSTLEGTLVDACTMQPIGGAHVVAKTDTAIKEELPYANLKTTTDASGVFALRNGLVGDGLHRETPLYTLEFNVPNYVRQSVSARFPGPQKTLMLGKIGLVKHPSEPGIYVLTSECTYEKLVFVKSNRMSFSSKRPHPSGFNMPFSVNYECNPLRELPATLPRVKRHSDVGWVFVIYDPDGETFSLPAALKRDFEGNPLKRIYSPAVLPLFRAKESVESCPSAWYPNWFREGQEDTVAFQKVGEIGHLRTYVWKAVNPTRGVHTLSEPEMNILSGNSPISDFWLFEVISGPEPPDEALYTISKNVAKARGTRRTGQPDM